jgi:hypothetical protein
VVRLGIARDGRAVDVPALQKVWHTAKRAGPTANSAGWVIGRTEAKRTWSPAVVGRTIAVPDTHIVVAWALPVT